MTWYLSVVRQISVTGIVAPYVLSNGVSPFFNFYKWHSWMGPVIRMCLGRLDFADPSDGIGGVRFPNGTSGLICP